MFPFFCESLFSLFTYRSVESDGEQSKRLLESNLDDSPCDSTKSGLKVSTEISYYVTIAQYLTLIVLIGSCRSCGTTKQDHRRWREAGDEKCGCEQRRETFRLVDERRKDGEQHESARARNEANDWQ